MVCVCVCVCVCVLVICRYGSLVGGVQVGITPHHKAVSNVDIALGYLDNDIIFHIKLCVLFCCIVCL